MHKKIAIFGATGSIGTQSLEVIRANPGRFSVSVLTAFSNVDILLKQAHEFKPAILVIGDASALASVRSQAPAGTTVLVGEEGLLEAAATASYDMMIAAIVGYAGLRPTLAAIGAGKDIALANKETLVVAGDIVMAEAQKHGVRMIPVDSEHSAIFQCLVGEDPANLEKIVLTASGGPFLGKKPNFLVNVKRDHALQHPNWSMGAKISIDSATLMNKGLEMIEARWLFGLQPAQIQTIVHPQSIIHSMVVFTDGSMKAQMGLPDMKLPIQYALAYPERIANNFPRYDFRRPDTLSFEEPDRRTFRNLDLAIEAMNKSGNLPCIMNAANEIAVYAFLKNRIGFLDMTDVVEQTMAKITFVQQPTLDDYFHSDGEARNFAASLIRM